MEKVIESKKTDEQKVLGQKFSFFSLRHLVIVSIASVPLTILLILLFMIILARAQSSIDLSKNLTP